MPDASPERRLSDDQVRRLWALMQEAKARPWTWRDEVRYRLTWRPRWALRLWRTLRGGR